MKVNLLLFGLGLALGLYLSFMYCVASRNHAVSPVPVVPVKQLQKEVAHTEKVFAEKLDSLQSENRKLVVSLDNTKAALQKSKAKSLVLEQKTKGIVKHNKETLESPYAYAASCDSLIPTVESLMQASVEKDSLYEQVVSGLEAQVKNKDSAINLAGEKYGSLKASFETSLQNQSLLQTENASLNKSAKRQKVKGKVVSALLFIVSGVAAAQFIHR